MSNMSYCRFRNTLGDLQDCQSALEAILGTEDGVERLSEQELRAAKRLVETCGEIVAMVSDAIPDAEVAGTEEWEKFEEGIEQVIDYSNEALPKEAV